MDMTWGEMLEFINVYNERERRVHQHESIIAFRQAELIASWVWKMSDINVHDVFPYWDKDEIDKMNVEKLKQRMYRHASIHRE